MTALDDGPMTGPAPDVTLIESPTVRAAPQRSKGARVAALVLPPLVLAVVLLAIWLFISYGLLDPRRRFLLRPPQDVLQVGFLTWDNLHEILDGAWSSLKVAALGLAIAVVLGVAVATLMSQTKLFERATFPYLVALQATPILALVPLIRFWFGTGTQARVLVCVLISFFPIVLNTLFGLVSADPGLHDLVTLHHGNRVTRLKKVMFPSALPAMFAGLRISAGLSVIGAIVGDMFFGQGEVGLGQLIRRYHLDLQGERLLAAIMVASMIGVLVFLGFGAIQHAVIGKWYDSKSGGG